MGSLQNFILCEVLQLLNPIICFPHGCLQLGHSVIESRSKDTLISLVDPRLGLPAEDERCATCGGTNYDECTGEDS